MSTFPVGVRLYRFCPSLSSPTSVWNSTRYEVCSVSLHCGIITRFSVPLYVCTCMCVLRWAGTKLGHKKIFWSGGGGRVYITTLHLLPCSSLIVRLLSYSDPFHLFQSHPPSWVSSCPPIFSFFLLLYMSVYLHWPLSLFLSCSSLFCFADKAFCLTFFTNDWHTSIKGGVGYTGKHHPFIRAAPKQLRQFHW